MTEKVMKTIIFNITEVVNFIIAVFNIPFQAIEETRLLRKARNGRENYIKE